MDRTTGIKKPTSNSITCEYINLTDYIQVLRINRGEDGCLERILYPRHYCKFKASPDAQLEVYTCEFITAILSDRISCNLLQVG